jgi:hypothetical protein
MGLLVSGHLATAFIDRPILNVYPFMQHNVLTNGNKDQPHKKGRAIALRAILVFNKDPKPPAHTKTHSCTDIEMSQPGPMTSLYFGTDATLLFRSILKGCDNDIVARFIAVGADPNIPTNLGVTPLHVAAVKDASDIIKTLVAAGAVVDAVDAKGNTPLHMAVYAGSFEAFKTLGDLGADVNKQNHHGSTALHIAVNNDSHSEFAADYAEPASQVA